MSDGIADLNSNVLSTRRFRDSSKHNGDTSVDRRTWIIHICKQLDVTIPVTLVFYKVLLETCKDTFIVPFKLKVCLKDTLLSSGVLDQELFVL